MLRRRPTMLVPALVFCLAVPGGSMISPFATEFTQLLNYAKLVQQLYQQAEMLKVQIEQYKHMTVQGAMFNSLQLGNMAHSMVLLGQNVRQGQGLAYTMARLDNIFKNAYPGYMTSKVPYDAQYRNWTKVDLDTISGILASIEAHTQDLNNDQMIFSFVQNRAKNAQGQDQILQAGLMMSDAQVQQLTKLRQLMQLQVTAMAVTEGRKAQTDAAEKQSATQAFGPGVFSHN